MMVRIPLLLLPLPLVLFAASPTAPSSRQEAGRREVLRSCQKCHTLDVVAVQKLSREDWADELRKMVKMGARVREREAVLDFLAAKYGEEPPAATPR